MIDELVAEAELGEASRKFIESELGQCLIGMARQDASEAQEELISVDPLDISKVRDLQNKAILARRFEQYLAELVHRGNNAVSVYKQQQENYYG